MDSILIAPEKISPLPSSSVPTPFDFVIAIGIAWRWYHEITFGGIARLLPVLVSVHDIDSSLCPSLRLTIPQL